LLKLWREDREKGTTFATRVQTGTFKFNADTKI
jgi:hypothetical protein